MAARHRLAGRFVRGALRGTSMATRMVVWTWFWSVLLPLLILYVLTMRPREPDSERG